MHSNRSTCRTRNHASTNTPLAVEDAFSPESPTMSSLSHAVFSLPRLLGRSPSSALQLRMGSGPLSHFSSTRPFMEIDPNGKAKIPADALLPHQIIAALFAANKPRDGEDEKLGVPWPVVQQREKVLERLWWNMVRNLSSMGKLKDSIAVCDVPLDVKYKRESTEELCVVMSMLISELSKEPWKGRVIPFSEDPKILEINGRECFHIDDSLISKVQSMEDGVGGIGDWVGHRVNYQKVFEEILKLAKERRLKPAKMIKRVFVFTHVDRNFEDSSFQSYFQGISWEDEYQRIQEMFLRKRYAVPEIVFWDLCADESRPPSELKGVVQVRGYSEDLLKLFMENNAVLSQKDIIEALDKTNQSEITAE